MKNIFIWILLIVGVTACDNQEQIFADYDEQNVYFPLQFPIRTISLGEDRVDNSLDKESKFDIGVSIGGMYKNNKDWTVDFVVDPSLTDSVYFDGEKILPLPTEYYTLNPSNTVTIPSGKFNGLIRVELNEKFYNDPLCITGRYVIPLRLTGTSADSILLGWPAVIGSDPDIRIKDDWKAGKSPKNWVLYGIKYVNSYHGRYLHRGVDFISKDGAPFDTVVFRTDHVVQDIVGKVSTNDLLKASTNFIATRVHATRFVMVLNFDNPDGKSGPITITPNPDPKRWQVTGTGHYYDLSESTEEWTQQVWQSMYLEYFYNDGKKDHHVHDTLVFRDRGIKWEEYSGSASFIIKE